jgi:multicomponent K+:H+ antiporter subunit E
VKRWLPYPLLAAGLLIMWLMLTQTFSVGHVLLGGSIAVLTTHATGALRPERSKVGSPLAIIKLFGLVVADIVRSNFAVAKIILSPASERVSGFVRFPLELQNPFGLTVLALIITATPGTMWVEYNATRSELLVHVLDLIDEEEWIRLIKRRYESLLLEIFQS